jgi:hypothetical protein
LEADVTPGERRLDELVCALAASQPVLHDFARARVAAKLRREIEELEDREAEEYGERAATWCEEMDAAHSERLAEIWCGLDDGEPAPEDGPEADDEAAREADLREAARGECSRGRRQLARWLALAGSAAAVSALMGLWHDLRGEEERPMLVSVEAVRGAPGVVGPALASESRSESRSEMVAAERCGEALPLLDEYLARYADRAKAPRVRRQRRQCEERVLVQRRRDQGEGRSATAAERD